jgi:hypothetical protein
MLIYFQVPTKKARSVAGLPGATGDVAFSGWYLCGEQSNGGDAMRRFLGVALLLAPLMASAQVYKCTGADGKVAFSDRPCAGAATQQETIAIQPRAPIQDAPTPAERDAEWEENKRFRYVEVPALERQAAELMASGDPQRQKLGEEMAWQAHKAKEAFEQLERARAARKETNARYDRALRDIQGY